MTSATTSKPIKRTRGEGQWALGYREPLNPNEQFKKDDDPLNVRARIVDTYSKLGFDSIDKQDLRGRMRWMGLYTQREQGYDGTWTGDENADLLEAKYFMMRVRCDGGALTTQALRTIGEISTEFARDTADISDRENIQYHWIEIENVPEIWDRLAAVVCIEAKAGEAFGDSLAGQRVRAMKERDKNPASGAEERIDALVARFISPAFASTAVAGLRYQLLTALAGTVSEATDADAAR